MVIISIMVIIIAIMVRVNPSYYSKKEIYCYSLNLERQKININRI
jgi:hypothetical protein